MNEKYESQYYHIYNRGSDKRDIFMDEWDCERFLEGLREYNTCKNVSLRDLHDKKEINKGSTSGNSPRLNLCSGPRLVEIFCYCLMPNHFHLILKELNEGGITKFMQKLNTGYTMYFNKKHDRSGHLFQGRYKSKEINSDFYLTYLTGYIHLNPVISDLVRLPEQYKYSSYLDYLGKKQADLLNFKPDELEIKIEDYEKFIMDLKNDKEALKKVEDVSLE